MMHKHFFHCSFRSGWLTAAVVLAALPLTAQQTTYRQQGDQLVREVRGSIAMSSPLQIRVVGQMGNVHLSPASGSTLQYDIDLSTRNDARARQRLDQLPVQVQQQGNTILISANGAASHRLEINVEVPSIAGGVRVDNAVGNITAAGLSVPLHLQTAAGNVSLDHVHATTWAASAGGNLDVSAMTGSLHATSAGGNIDIGNLDGDGWAVTQGGNIEVDQVRGGLHATTAGGRIRVRSATGDVDAMTAGGTIELGSIHGMVHARTGGGNIQIGHARSADAATGGGNIEITAVAGPVTAQTGAGSVQVGIVAANGSFGNSRIESGIGRITVLLPAQLAANVTAELGGAMGHSIRSDFAALNAGPHGAASLHAEAALNGGGPSLRIATHGGDIVIRKQSATALRSAVNWNVSTAKPYGN